MFNVLKILFRAILISRRDYGSFDSKNIAKNWLKLEFMKRRNSEPKSPVKLHGSKVYFPKGGFGNLRYLYREIFVDQTYGVKLPTSPRILDAGANIGLASFYLSLVYPNARITAFEPAPSCLDYLKSNIGWKDNVECHFAG